MWLRGNHALLIEAEQVLTAAGITCGCPDTPKVLVDVTGFDLATAVLADVGIRVVGAVEDEAELYRRDESIFNDDDALYLQP